jgi:PmbA protein
MPRAALKSFADRAGRDLDLAEHLVEEALLAGAEEAEVYLKTSRTQGIQLRGRFATLSGGSDRGIALRVFDAEGHLGHAFSSWSEGLGGKALIRTALESLRGAAESAGAPGSSRGPASRWESAPDPLPGLVDERVAAWTAARKRELVEGAVRSAGEAARIKSASYRDGISRIAIANSRGVKAAMVRTLALVGFTRWGTGGPALVSEMVGNGPDPDVIRAAAEELVRLDPAGNPESPPSEVLLLEPPAAVSLLRHLERRLVARAGSPEEKFRKVAADLIDVVDDGRLPGGVASAPFDGEGRPTGKVTLVKAGVRIERLRPPRREEEMPPGNMVRISYRDLPAPGATNLYILPGPRSLETIRSEMERGLLLARLAPESKGDRPGEGVRWQGIGWEIRDGAVTGPCRRFVFHADAARLLEAVREVGSPVGFVLRRGAALGAPPLLVRTDFRLA